jgi:peptidyl-prolyl cis-trans isomerase B (cyclophilin B)
MKRQIVIALPALLLFAGCNAPANDAGPGDAPSTAAPTDTAKTEAPKTQTPAPKEGDKKETAQAPDPKYKVVDEGNPQFPSEVLTALDKAKVSPPPVSPAAPKRARVTLSTTKGDIVVELNGEAAPLHVKSFLYLVGRGFYDGTVFHRYEPGFVIQGGDPLSKNPKLGKPYESMTGSPSGFFGMGGPGYQVPRERNSLKHDKFVLAAARSSDPDSAGSQFYITLAPAPNLDQGDGYTVFGKVLSGQAAVMKLRAGDKLNQARVAVAASKKP